MSAGVVILDSSGRVAFANKAVRDQFRLDDSVIGRTLMEALRLHPLNALLERAVAGESHAIEEIEIAHIGLPSISYLAGVSRLDPGEESHAAVVVLHDLSPFRQIERARADFVANVSHELRTPLSIIKGYAETLSGGTGEPDDYANYAAIIEKHADRLTHLVNDLLTLSGIESGQIEIDLQRFPIEPFATRVLADLAGKAAPRRISLRLEAPPGISLFADVGRIQQVLVNLIGNAIAYGREEGRVTLSILPGNGETILSVIDDGPGIPPGDRERVFERFYRLDRARSRDSGGTGLGLAIVKHIALAHNGRVWVEETPGGGATFCIALPERLEADQAESKEREPENTRNPRTNSGDAADSNFTL